MSVFDLLNIFPDFAKIAVYLFAKSHLDHYVQQYHKVDMDNIKKALNNRGQSKTVRDLLIEEAKNLLTDEKIGPAALMFTAGYLRKELVIHNEEGVTDYLCACPCAEGVEVQHIYHDKGDNFYPLSHKDLWRADGPSTRSKIPDNYQTLEEDNKGCLPGMESDSVIFRRYGHEIWQGDLNRLSKGHWLDDSLIYVAIRHHQETYATEEIYTFDPVFSRKLLAKENCPDDGSRLILHSCNIDLVNAYSRRIPFEEKRLILIPICDNTHWILASFCPKTFTVTIMCSMGGCYRKTAQSLGRYFAAMYAKSFEDVKISHAKVQKQQNGNDCGVFVVGYAECLMKNGNLADWKVKGRSQLLKIIKKMY
ncbi:sentrin-specific protease 1-like isoform X1 [Mytilus trossulus]|uniref:sentrin-specific protease 1-like isoform X1 n=1 Tax=Mytilus trossulus TaxID=6551 RepID=UPI003005B35D